MDIILLIAIFASVIIGVLSAAYFYQSSSVFMDALRKPLKWIGGGMIIISVGVLISAGLSYEMSQGYTINFLGLPLATFFYILYLLGSIMIAYGASKLTRKPKPIGSAV